MNPSASEWIFRPNRRRPEVRLTDFQSWAYRQVEIERRRVVVPVAARPSGKSTIARLLAILAGLDDRPGDVGYMAPTLEQARRLFWRPLMEDLREPAARQFVMGRPDKGRMTLEFVTGTRLYVYSAEAHERVRGDGFKRFITDETGDPLFTDEVFDETLDGALVADRGQLIQIGTPKGRGRFYASFPGDEQRTGKEVSVGGQSILGLLRTAVFGTAGVLDLTPGTGECELIPVLYNRETDPVSALSLTQVSDQFATQKRRGYFGRPNTLPAELT